MTKNNRNLREIANQIMGRVLFPFSALFRRSKDARVERAQVPQMKLRAFTLAEVLITLVIIGVVSVLVLPTVINKVQGYANKRAHMVFQSKIKTGIQLMTGSNALVGYQTTEQFVEQFKKYIKIAKTCDNQHLTECFSSKVTDLAGKEIEIKPGMKLMDLYGTALNGATDTNVNGVILQDGTNILLAYNTNCVQPQNGSVDLSCISMVYDTNGGSAPNKLSDGNTFAVNLGTKEDNSNLNTIKDVGQINAPQFGTPVGMTEAKCRSFNNTIDGSSTVKAIVYNNKCAIFKNYTSWNEITNNLHTNDTTALTEDELKAWCESKYGLGMKLASTNAILKTELIAIQSSSNADYHINCSMFSCYSNGDVGLWAGQSYHDVSAAYMPRIRYGEVIIADEFTYSKLYVDNHVYAACFGDLVD